MANGIGVAVPVSGSVVTGPGTAVIYNNGYRYDTNNCNECEVACPAPIQPQALPAYNPFDAGVQNVCEVRFDITANGNYILGFGAYDVARNLVLTTMFPTIFPAPAAPTPAISQFNFNTSHGYPVWTCGDLFVKSASAAVTATMNAASLDPLGNGACNTREIEELCDICFNGSGATIGFPNVPLYDTLHGSIITIAGIPDGGSANIRFRVARFGVIANTVPCQNGRM